MASEHMFGVGRGRVGARRAEQVDRVARQHGARFTYATIPGDGPKYWFTCENLSEPFNSATEREVYAALEAAKLPSLGRL